MVTIEYTSVVFIAVILVGVAAFAVGYALGRIDRMGR